MWLTEKMGVMVVIIFVALCLVSLSEGSEGVEVQPDGSQTKVPTDSDGTEVNIARRRRVVAFAHSKDFGPEKAVDGDPNSRWIADVETPQTLVIDLMCTHALVNHVNILWEASYATKYSISASNQTAKPGQADLIPWEVVTVAHASRQGWTMDPMAIHARYIKLECLTTLSAKKGCSLFELEVIGYLSEIGCASELMEQYDKAASTPEKQQWLQQKWRAKATEPRSHTPTPTELRLEALAKRVMGPQAANKRLLGVAVPIAPRKSGLYFEQTFDTLPSHWPITVMSRLPFDISDHPQVHRVVKALNHSQLSNPEKLNHRVVYRGSVFNDDTSRTRWRSNLVLDASHMLESAAQDYHYFLYLEDDILVRRHAPDWIYGMVEQHLLLRLAIADPNAEGADTLLGVTRDLRARAERDKRMGRRNPHHDASTPVEPWAFSFLSVGGMLGVLWDSRRVPEAVAELRSRFDEKPVDWLLRTIKQEKQWQTPNAGRLGLISHMGEFSTFTLDKKPRGFRLH